MKFPPKLKFFAIRQIKFPPKLSFLAIRKIKFPPKLLFFAIREKCFCFRQLSSSIYHTVNYRYFEHRAISNKSLKNTNRQRMRDKNYSLFISLLKLVNFNNTFALLLYFFLCQDTSGKMFLSIRQNKFAPKFNFFVIRQIKFRQITSLLRSAKISSHQNFFP